jgi:hypothetical protein
VGAMGSASLTVAASWGSFGVTDPQRHGPANESSSSSSAGSAVGRRAQRALRREWTRPRRKRPERQGFAVPLQYRDSVGGRNIRALQAISQIWLRASQARGRGFEARPPLTRLEPDLALRSDIRLLVRLERLRPNTDNRGSTGHESVVPVLYQDWLEVRPSSRGSLPSENSGIGHRLTAMSAPYR